MDKADEARLRQAYEVFQEQALNLKADYTLKTVNTDGWSATQNAWQYLFPKIAVIGCFLGAAARPMPFS